MKYIRQVLILLTITFLGEALHALLPLPVPAGIYGLVLLFLALCLGLVRLEQVKDAGSFLLALMPAMFVPACVGLLDVWDYLRPRLVPILVILVVGYFATFAAAGHTAQWLGRRGKK